MKKLIRLLSAVLLVCALGCSTPQDRENRKPMDLDVLKTAYTKIASIKVTGGAEERELSASELMYFSLFMNNLETLTVLKDEEVPADPIVLKVLTRSTEDDISIKSPYLYVNGYWFRVADAELENLDRMQDIVLNGLD